MAFMGDRRGAYKVLFRWGDPMQSDHLEDLGVGSKYYEIGSSRSEMGRRGLFCCGSGQQEMAGSCKNTHELSDCIKCEEILD